MNLHSTESFLGSCVRGSSSKVLPSNWTTGVFNNKCGCFTSPLSHRSYPSFFLRITHLSQDPNYFQQGPWTFVLDEFFYPTSLSTRIMDLACIVGFGMTCSCCQTCLILLVNYLIHMPRIPVMVEPEGNRSSWCWPDKFALKLFFPQTPRYNRERQPGLTRTDCNCQECIHCICDGGPGQRRVGVRARKGETEDWNFWWF